VTFLCFLCGTPALFAPLVDDLPSLAVCPECCLEHEYERVGPEGDECAYCGKPAPYEWYEDDDPY
jgi:hypothetical protein